LQTSLQSILKPRKKNLQKILGESEKLKSFEIKKWLRLKAKANSKSPQRDDSSQKKEISMKYLMSAQEIKQNDIIEELFKKVDADGSGGLDPDELYEIFHDNKMTLDKEMICKLFDITDEFTLEKLKSMIDNEVYLNKFKKIFS